MTTSLASSPVLPIVMAGVAGLLVVGTLSSSATSSGGAAEDPTAYVPVELPGTAPAPAPAAAGGEITTNCEGKTCTITFPAEGGSVKVLGTTVKATKFYSDGITLTIAGKALTSNLATPATGKGFTTQTTKVEAGTQSPHTVRITKN